MKNILLTNFLLSFHLLSIAQWLPVEFRNVSDQSVAEVLVDGKLFTAFRYGSTLEKPVLFPVQTSKGTIVTRGFPLAPRAGERIDHPHHVGVWFNFGSVNGIDFWNNSTAIPPAEKHHYGTVKVIGAPNVTSGNASGELAYTADWVDHNGAPVVTERTKMVFTGSGALRVITRTTTLIARQQPVVFKDNKEGLLAFRVDRAFEEPITEPEVMVDAQGKPTAVPVLNNQGVNGKYRNSSGIEGGAAWGQRAAWVKLSAEKEGENITIAMIDHGQNYGFPAHWHARTYGLFSVNNFGSKVFVPNDPEQILTLSKDQTLTFKHQILIGPTSLLTDEFMNQMFTDFNR
ncbi:MAG: PmoA family protein [Bacteroidetes bacterium]|nr:PmoA family protein [Bacteroidota bacterium]